MLLSKAANPRGGGGYILPNAGHGFAALILNTY